MKKSNLYFTDQKPEKNINWETGDDGKIYLLKEKSRNKLMKRVIDLFGKNQFFRIHLDDTGTLVWKNINGKNSIKEIGDIVKKEKGGESFLHPEKRVEHFIALMLKNKFIKVRQEKQGPE
ncbi:MAG: PqqD family protein [Candidatus Aminicenantes bacterium]|nr:PqqD family protein [Candidatus Aminicenantes bacterium]MCK5003633.1 PqqD family protein [Candidatus Aminicenantes bacterium]